MASIQAEIDAIEAQIKALLPLITLPHDLGSVITWITNFAAPLIKTYNEYAAQLTATLAQIARIAAAVEAAAARFLTCEINIPTITTSP